jgi:Fur family ferric uptake transcriptional regulator
MTDQRHVVARALAEARGHPSILDLYGRAKAHCPRISLGTVYRSLQRFEAAGIVTRQNFRDAATRYEVTEGTRHGHLIDVATGAITDLKDTTLESAQAEVAQRLGFRLIGYRLELYGAPVKAVKRRAETVDRRQK